MQEKPTATDDVKDILARKRTLTRRLFVVIAAAILTIVTCLFLGLRFGSADQAILTLMTIALVALALRVFRSKGRFRFASLLLLTAFCALVFRMVLTPLKRQSDQRAAIALVDSRGGSVATYGGSERYPENAHGWVLNDSGYLYPAFLAYVERRYLNPVEVYELKISSSLLTKSTWQALQCKHLRSVEVLLDGSGDANEFCDILSEQVSFFPNFDSYFYRPLVFVPSELSHGNIDFLNAMRWGGLGRELPAIRLGFESHFEPKLLEGLDVGFELVHSGLYGDPQILERVIQVNKMKRLTLFRWKVSANVLKAVSSRAEHLERMNVYETDFDEETWPMLCNLTNCRAIRLSDLSYQGGVMDSAILKQLSQNKSIQELVLYLDESQAPAIPFLMKIEGLLRLEVHCDAKYTASLLAAMEHSTLEEVWLNMQPESDASIQWQPWMGKMKSLKVVNREIVAPNE